jgi:hypothetical protein
MHPSPRAEIVSGLLPSFLSCIVDLYMTGENELRINQHSIVMPLAQGIAARHSDVICCGTAILAVTVHGRDARATSK